LFAVAYYTIVINFVFTGFEELMQTCLQCISAVRILPWFNLPCSIHVECSCFFCVAKCSLLL